MDCGDPGALSNGQRSLSSTTYNSVVTYTCDVGYTLQGSNSRTCQSNGQWSGNVPQCRCEFRSKSWIVVTLHIRGGLLVEIEDVMHVRGKMEV